MTMMLMEHCVCRQVVACGQEKIKEKLMMRHHCTVCCQVVDV